MALRRFIDTGEARICLANGASEEAVTAAEQIKLKQRALLEAEYGEEALFSTPGKHRKLK